MLPKKIRVRYLFNITSYGKIGKNVDVDGVTLTRALMEKTVPYGYLVRVLYIRDKVVKLTVNFESILRLGGIKKNVFP